MSRSIALSLLCLLAFVFSANAQSITQDTNRSMLPADSLRILDSAYRARKALLDQWIHTQREAAHPQEDFISVYASYGAYLQILPRDLNQLFSERTLRPDPQTDRNNYGTVDRAIILGGAAQLSNTWGIYTEYNYTGKFFNTQIDSNYLGLNGTIEELDVSEHSFVVGGMFVFYNTKFYRLRANGGIGGVFVSTSEIEGGTSRSASTAGYQFNFDLLNDFRVLENVSFTIDFLTRSITTGTLKTSDSKTLDSPFGKRTTPLSVTPNASNVLYGFAAGLVYYF